MTPLLEGIISARDADVQSTSTGATTSSSKPCTQLLLGPPCDVTARTSHVSASPAEVHFPVSGAGEPSECVVRLTNTADASTRVMVVPPATPHFKVAHELRGPMAPGLSQRLLVSFTGATELGHVSDAIQVQTEGGGLLIPLHAYPVSGCVLPKHLDLGLAKLGERVSNELLLRNAAGVPFDFAVTVLQHNSHFAVAPLTGTVPAHGSTAVHVSFTPTRYSTEHLRLQVQLAEFGTQPMTVLVSGSSRSGLVQQRMLQEATQKQQQQQQQQHEDSLDGATPPQQQPEPQQHGRLRSSRSRSPRRGTTGTSSGLHGVLSSVAGHTAITQHGVNSLLNQRPGRLGVKDARAAIAARKEALAAEQVHVTAALESGRVSGIDPLERPDLSPRVKEALFQLQLREAVAGVRSCSDAGAQGHVGSTPPMADKLQHMRAARQAAMELSEAKKRDAARHRLELSMQAAGALNVLPDAAAAATSSSSNSGYPGLEGFSPQWQLLSNSSDWRKRVHVAQRFVQAARVVIHRNRAQARLKKLKALAAKLAGGRDSLLFGGQELQQQVLEGSAEQRPPGMALSDFAVHRPPAWPDTQHTPVDTGLPYADLSALEVQPYRAEFEYKLLGYEPKDLAPVCVLGFSALPNVDQPLLPCPGEDSAEQPLPCGLLPAAVSSLARMDEMPWGLRSVLPCAAAVAATAQPSSCGATPAGAKMVTRGS